MGTAEEGTRAAQARAQSLLIMSTGSGEEADEEADLELLLGSIRRTVLTVPLDRAVPAAGQFDQDPLALILEDEEDEGGGDGSDGEGGEHEEHGGHDAGAGGGGGAASGSGVPAIVPIRFTAADVPQAFSHFTYAYTKRRMLVCDLQGVLDEVASPPVFELTDPVIHYSSRSGRRQVFGKTDRGGRGVSSFFRTHECSELCKAMRRTWWVPPAPRRQGAAGVTATSEAARLPAGAGW